MTIETLEEAIELTSILWASNYKEKIRISNREKIICYLTKPCAKSNVELDTFDFECLISTSKTFARLKNPMLLMKKSKIKKSTNKYLQAQRRRPNVAFEILTFKA